MNPRRRTASKLRLTLVMATLLLAAGAGYYIKISPPIYLESATVELSLPKAESAPNDYDIYAYTLITSSEVMVQTLMSPSVQRQIRATGNGATVNFALLDLYNEEYPQYGYPLATLTAASPAAVDAHRAFAAAARALALVLAARQEQLEVAPDGRITARILGDSGPVLQTGSRSRVFGGLALLTAIAVGLAWNGAGRWGTAVRPEPGSLRARTFSPGLSQPD
jgi:hypothetical protein